MEDNKIELEDEFQCDCEECNGEEEIDEIEEAFGKISLQQELDRWELQTEPISETSETTINSNYFKQSMIYAETIGEVVQTLLGYGIDYNNAMAVANNMMLSDQSLKQADKQNIQIQSQQI